MINAVVNQGFAGAFAIAAHGAGFRLLYNTEYESGFGIDSVRANARLIGQPDLIQAHASEWPGVYDDVHVVLGNPPCSGFSGINTAGKGGQKRGEDSVINHCMIDLVDYGQRLNAPVIMLESVQGAYKNGRGLMQRLRAIAGEDYHLNHVLVSGAALGAAQTRRRYFMVLTRGRPLEVSVPGKRDPVTNEEALGDLRGLCNTWELQQYAVPHRGVTAFQAAHRKIASGTDSHAWMTSDDGSVHARRVEALLDTEQWLPGMKEEDVLWEVYTLTGDVPAPYDLAKLKEREFKLRFQQPKRLRPNKPGYVMTGTGGLDFVHWEEDRLLSVRECARLQGFPDDWTFQNARGIRQALAWIGKGIPVQSGRWIAEQVRGWVLEQPGEAQGIEVGDREWLIDVTNAHLGRVTAQAVA